MSDEQVVKLVYVINLDEDEERLARFREINRHLPIVRQSAVDGRSLDRRQLQDQGHITENLSYNNGTLGAALSHIGLWRRALDAQATITIAEDDAIFARDFVVTANAFLQRLPNNWDIVMWGWNFDEHLWIEMPEGVSLCALKTDQDELRRNIDAFRTGHFTPTPIRLRHMFGNMAYTVSADGAAKLLKSCLPLRDQLIPFFGFGGIKNISIDAMMNAVYPNIRAYVSIPPLTVSENRPETSWRRNPSFCATGR
jgi:GR25 family glycosyltransferase involved in LPS biosynthesis